MPIASVLREFLVALNLETGGRGLAFGEGGGERPFRSGALRQRADSAWEKTGLRRITLHECRHTFASLMIRRTTSHARSNTRPAPGEDSEADPARAG